MNLKSIIYISTKVHNFSKDDLEALLARCEENNRASNITGCLIYNGMNFMQLIEGDEEAIDACMARILKDDRHSGIVTIREKNIDSRECPEWGMAGRHVSAQPDTDERAQIAEMLENAASDTRRLFDSFSSL